MHDNDEFERRTKALFGRSVSTLDAKTRAQLAQARAKALDELQHRPVQRWRVWAPVAGVAVAALASVAVLIETRSQRQPAAVPLEDLDLLAHEDLDMMQDLEFYAWLDEQPEWESQT